VEKSGKDKTETYLETIPSYNCVLLDHHLFSNDSPTTKNRKKCTEQERESRYTNFKSGPFIVLLLAKNIYNDVFTKAGFASDF
jgi:hypothetical protein